MYFSFDKFFCQKAMPFSCFHHCRPHSVLCILHSRSNLYHYRPHCGPHPFHIILCFFHSRPYLLQTRLYLLGHTSFTLSQPLSHYATHLHTFTLGHTSLHTIYSRLYLFHSRPHLFLTLLCILHYRPHLLQSRL